MSEEDFSINLNHLTVWEKLSHPETFADYKQAVVGLLMIKETYLFEQDLLETFGNDSLVKSSVKHGKEPLEAIFESHDTFVSAGKRPNKKYNNTLEKAWIDLAQTDLFISPDDFLFDLFFIYKLRQTDLLKVDKLLNFFLTKYYEDDLIGFSRFLKLAVRKHGKKLLQDEQIETVNEWLEEKEKQQTLSGTESTKTKGKIKREREDNLTKLNQEQTALLIYCLKNTKVILKDEYLNNKETGQAFSILTGYSADTLRQNLNKSELARIASLKNVEVVLKALKELQRFIEKEIKPEK